MVWYIGGLFGLLLVAALIRAAVQGEEEFRRWRERGVKTQGVVVRHEVHTDDTHPSYQAVVRFRTPDGATVEALDTHSVAAGGLPAYAVGTTVTLIYEPTNPYACAVLGTGIVYPWGEMLPPQTR